MRVSGASAGTSKNAAAAAVSLPSQLRRETAVDRDRWVWRTFLEKSQPFWWVLCLNEVQSYARIQPHMQYAHVFSGRTEIGSVEGTESLFPGPVSSLTLASGAGEGGMRG